MNQKRNLLKKAASLSVVFALAPTSWTKPIVSSIALPAHAQTSVAGCSDAVSVDFFQFDPGSYQFGIDGRLCTLNNDASVRITFEFIPREDVARGEGDYEITVEDATGVAANFTFSSVGSGGVDSRSVTDVRLIDSIGRNWRSTDLFIAINALNFEVFGEFAVDT